MIRSKVRDLIVALALLGATGGVSVLFARAYGVPAGTLDDPRDIVYAILALVALILALRALVALTRVGRGDYAVIATLVALTDHPGLRWLAAILGISLAAGVSTGRASAAGTPPGPATTPTTVVQPRPVVAGRQQRTPGRGRAARPVDAPAAARPRHRPVKRATRAAGEALRYRVQEGDNMEAVAERFGLPGWRSIWAVTRLHDQPVGGRITNPALIYPGQELLIPLPTPLLAMRGDDVVYVARAGDNLWSIASLLTGDGAAFRVIADLNRAPRGPLGADNVVRERMVLVLPRSFLTSTATDGRPPLVVARQPLRRAARLRLRQSPRAGAPRPAHECAAGPAHVAAPPAAARQTAASRRASRRVRPAQGVHRRVVHTRRVPAKPAPVAPAVPAQVPRPAGHLTPRSGQPHASAPSAASRRHTRRMAGAHGTHRRVVRPRPGVRPAFPAYRPQPDRATSTASHAVARQPTTPGLPMIYVRDLQRVLPACFILAFLSLVGVVAARRRKGLVSVLGHIPTHGATPLAPSVRRAIVAARRGAMDSFTRALTRQAAAVIAQGAITPYLLTALATAAGPVGLPTDLVRRVRLVTETATHIYILLEAYGLADDKMNGLAAALGAALGVEVAVSRAREERQAPLVTIGVLRAGLQAPSTVTPHPLPLLVPVGYTEARDVLYLNLGLADGLLLSGGGGGTHTLVGTLLASILPQADPATLRLLVVSDDEELRQALVALAPFLEAPVADADDAEAQANRVKHAQSLTMDRFVARSKDPVGAPMAGSPEQPDVLLVLCNVERLAANQSAVAWLDQICDNGDKNGVHVLATTANPPALRDAGLLDLFRTRLVRLSGTAHDTILTGLAPNRDGRGRDADARALVYARDGHNMPLTPYVTTVDQVRTVLAHVHAALMLPDASPLAGAPPPSATPSPPTPSATPSPPTPAEPRTGGAAMDTPPDAPETPAASGDVGAAPAPAPTEGPPNAHEAAAPEPVATSREGTAPESEQQPESEERSAAGGDGGDVGTDDDADVAIDVDTLPHADKPITISLFGDTPDIRHRGMPIADTNTRAFRLLATLAYLGPEPVSRTLLDEATGGGSDNPSGRVSRIVTEMKERLRAAGMPAVMAQNVLVKTRRTHFELNQRLVDVDLYRFRALIESIAGCEDEDESLPVLQEAAAIVKKRTLAPADGVWGEPICYNAHRLVRDTYYNLAVIYHRRRDYDKALDAIVTVTNIDPLDEHAHQLAIDIYDDKGDYEGMDEHYRNRCAAFDADPGIPRDPYTDKLYERRRNGRRSPGRVSQEEAKAG